MLLEHLCPLIPQSLISALHNPITVCLHDDVICDGGGDYARCECTSCRVVVSQICIITGEIKCISKEEAAKCSIAFFSYSGHFQARTQLLSYEDALCVCSAFIYRSLCTETV